MKFEIKIEEMSLEQLSTVVNALKGEEIEVKAETEVEVTPVVNAVVNEPVVNAVEETADTVDFDKEGLAWDERIHSSNHKLTAQGVWQRRRGISDIEYQRIKAELLGQVEEIVATPVNNEPEVVVPMNTAQVEVIAPTVIPTPTPEPVAPVVEVEDAATLYNTMFEKLKSALATHKIDANFMREIINTVNITYSTNYQGFPDIRDNVEAMKFVINDLTTRGY